MHIELVNQRNKRKQHRVRLEKRPHRREISPNPNKGKEAEEGGQTKTP